MTRPYHGIRRDEASLALDWTFDQCSCCYGWGIVCTVVTEAGGRHICGGCWKKVQNG